MKHRSVKSMTVTALFAAMLCILSPLTVPIGPVPVSLASLAVLLTAALLGAGRGTAAVCVYILLGMIGLPVFSGFSGGFHKLAGATGGYIIGYIPLALVTGLAADRSKKLLPLILGMVSGTAVLYALGTAWFCVAAKAELAYALSVCVLPFLLFDALKIAAAALLRAVLAPRLQGVLKMH